MDNKKSTDRSTDEAQQASPIAPDPSLAVTDEMQKPHGIENSEGFREARDSGGGIRTPDTRIMIPLL